MKLYYLPAACSLAPHIIANEIGLPLELVKVEFTPEGKFAGGESYANIAPKGAVPALRLDSGEVITEAAAVIQYLAAQRPEAGLMPSEGMARWRALEQLNFIATELHKSFAPMMNPSYADVREVIVSDLRKRWALASDLLGDRPYLAGDHFTAPDAYLFTALGWPGFVGLSLSDWPNLEAYRARVSERPAVQRALAAEGLIA